jgi:hypothetical protein
MITMDYIKDQLAEHGKVAFVLDEFRLDTGLRGSANDIWCSLSYELNLWAYDEGIYAVRMDFDRWDDWHTRVRIYLRKRRGV